MAFRHDNGESSMVKTEEAGMGMRCIQIANLPTEVPIEQYETCSQGMARLKT